MDSMENDIKDCTSLDEVFKMWNTKDNHIKDTFVKDGIIDPDVWNVQDKKILYILKEAYDEDKTENWDLTERVLKGDNILSSPTWRSVIDWTYGILNTTADRIARYSPKDIKSQRDELIRKIAVLNLKKTPGKPRSDMEQIRQFALDDIVQIKRQIEIISPDIIVCGSTLKALDEALKAKGCKAVCGGEKCDNWFYFTDAFTETYPQKKEILVIDYYHPAIHWAALVNYYALTSIYQQALLEKTP
ncbi:MAG: hypothetical protein NC395_08935 [Prevotella sp.]|nr:hypothetical protein [Prevotella sp.]